ncbi:MAG: GHKL domain-containing protein [Clostridium sp.]|uniref:GHKL domain-containing protein n=1 Tax=Clostridium sp. TaxID=1506 RepID=UPI003F2B4063
MNILKTKDDFIKDDINLDGLNRVKLYNLKGIIRGKIVKAQSLGLNIILDIPGDIEVLNLKIIDLSRILGILLDNAIEGAGITESKKIGVGIFNKENELNIIIENSFKDEGMYLYEMLVEGKSTKGDGRGIGLTIVNEILSKYNNVVLDTKIENGMFIQHIIID